ncbi:MAG TPA: methionyl-tRNA formyltransferase [Pseudomonadales bacterium]
MPHTVPARLRLGFAGTPAFAAEFLGTLIGRHDVVVVFSQPPRRTGRGRKLEQSAVHDVAMTHSIPVNTPTSLRGIAPALAAFELDALVVVAYGLILPKSILDTPRMGCINVHASLLPRWRGAAPIERAILAGDTATGVSIMRMDEGLDTGPLLAKVECPIRSIDTGDSVRDRLAEIGAVALLDCLDRLDALVPQPQPTQGVSYAHKLAPEESRIDWTASADEVARKIRGLNSRQPAFCLVGDQRLRLLFGQAIPTPTAARPGVVSAIDRRGVTVACGDGNILITQVALSRGSGKPMDIASLINGHPKLITPGQVLA